PPSVGMTLVVIHNEAFRVVKNLWIGSRISIKQEIPPSVGMTFGCHSERSFLRSEESMKWKQDFIQTRDSFFRRNDKIFSKFEKRISKK
ncbi:MAG TPA: hypothetical protein VFM70_08575, partial [Salinimicrobium sp.]|nr:hypothetical protein [Salinimicrobium sp.]